jgi:hypothetical protein
VLEINQRPLASEMRRDDEVVPAPATNQNRRRVATKAAWPVGEIARSGAENGYAALVALMSGHCDETSCRNGAITGASAAVCSSVAGLSWGKPVFKLTVSSQLAESLARGRVQFQRDGTSTQWSRGRVSRNAGGEVWSRVLVRQIWQRTCSREF